MSLVLQSSGGGQITIQEPATASNFTQTLPAATGTVMVSGNMPAFSAYLGSNQTGVSSNVWTKVNINTENFDTANCYSSSRFTPNVAGYYQINAQIDQTGAGLNYAIPAIYKNGSAVLYGNYISGTNGEMNMGIGGLVYCNGTTDYIEIYALGLLSSGTATYYGGQVYQTWVTGFLARAA
jgi:hypothetical protein